MTTTDTIAAPADAPYTLPPGWCWARLGDVCELNPRRPAITRPDDAATTFVPMPAVAESGAGIVAAEQKPYSEIKKGYTYFAEGDVLFAKITPCMQNGKHAIASGLIDGFGFGSTEFHVARPDAHTAPEWIHYFLIQPAILRRAEAYLTGAVGQQRVPQSFLATLPIPLPPLAEQRRIAAILRERLAAVDHARAAAEARLAAARALPAAELHAVFESEEAQVWPRVRLGDVAKVQSGYAFKSEWFAPAGIRLLRNVNVAQGYVSWDDTAFLPLDRRHEFSTYELREGEIVLSLDRPLVSSGLKLTRLSRSDVPALLLQRVARFHVGDVLSTDYLYTFLSTQAFIDAITQHDQSLGVPHVSPSQVEAVPLPLPPLAEQRRIAARLEERMAGAERVRAAVEGQLAAINALPAALLRRAFRGEL